MIKLDGSIDMILCDLPYGTTACTWDEVIPFGPLWVQYERIIKKNGAIVLFSTQPFTTKLIMSNPKLFRYEIIWKKTQPTGFYNANKMPLRAHENILVFYKKLRLIDADEYKKALCAGCRLNKSEMCEELMFSVCGSRGRAVHCAVRENGEKLYVWRGSVETGGAV